MNKILIVGGMKKGHGISEYIVNTYGYLSASTDYVFIFISETGANDFNNFFKQLQCEHIEICPFWKNPVRYIYQWIVVLMKNKDSLAIHFHYDKLYFKWIPVFLARLLGFHNIIIQSHNALPNMGFILDKLNSFGKYIVNKCGTLFIAVSNKAGEYMFFEKTRNNKNYSVIKNGINTLFFQFNLEKRQAIRLDNEWNDKFIIGNVGRLESQKNQTFLINLLPKLVRKNTNIILVIVGSGSKKRELEEQAEKLGVSQNLCILPYRKDIQEMYNAFDVFLFPSLYEGLPLSVIEAESSGLFCLISSNITSEVVFKERCKQLKLIEDTWIKELERIMGTIKVVNKNRINYAALVSQAGMDIKRQVRTMKGLYEELKS